MSQKVGDRLPHFLLLRERIEQINIYVNKFIGGEFDRGGLSFKIKNRLLNLEIVSKQLV